MKLRKISKTFQLGMILKIIKRKIKIHKRFNNKNIKNHKPYKMILKKLNLPKNNN